MFIMIGIIALIMYGVLVYYIGWSGYRWLRPETSSRRFKILYILVVTFAASSFFMGRASDVTIIGKIGAYWMAVFYLLLMIVPVAHLTVILLRFTRLPRHKTKMWTGAAALALLLCFFAYGSYNAYNPVVRTYTIQMEDRPRSVHYRSQWRPIHISGCS